MHIGASCFFLLYEFKMQDIFTSIFKSLFPIWRKMVLKNKGGFWFLMPPVLGLIPFWQLLIVCQWCLIFLACGPDEQCQVCLWASSSLWAQSSVWCWLSQGLIQPYGNGPGGSKVQCCHVGTAQLGSRTRLDPFGWGQPGQGWSGYIGLRILVSG